MTTEVGRYIDYGGGAVQYLGGWGGTMTRGWGGTMTRRWGGTMTRGWGGATGGKAEKDQEVNVKQERKNRNGE